MVSLLLALAWLWMDSENRTKQEIALILIAVAAGFKLYPALVGVVYIKRKEWKKVFRLIVYGVIAVFVPFLFFGGGDGLLHLVHTLTGFATYIDAGKTNTVCGMAKWLGLKLNMVEVTADAFAVGVNYLFFVCSILFFFLSKKKWQEALFINGILVSFLPSNWEYTLIYYLAVLFLFMKEYDGDLKKNQWRTNVWVIFHIVSFGLVFSVDFLMLYYRYGLISGIFTVTYTLIGINMLVVLGGQTKNILKRMESR